MLTSRLNGGLGNQLFQLAGGETIAKHTNRHYFVESLITPRVHHSPENYFDSIFRNWKPLYKEPSGSVSEFEERFQNRIEAWDQIVSGDVVLMHGYFQNYNYIPDDFTSRLSFDTSVLVKYPRLQNSAFLHIRGGDYRGASLFFMDLDNYYKKAIRCFPLNTHFYVFTNDIGFALSKEFLKHVSHTFVHENDINSLFLMSKCALGGICANSTFSWWGAYLNRNRTLTMPSKWFNWNSADMDGYFFPDATVIDVE